MDDVPQVLFVCVRNAGRSQIAAALLHHHATGRVRVVSAGSAPADAVHANVRAVMREWGIDLAGAAPTALRDEFVETSDVVITMGCGDACSVYPGTRYLDWDVPDPAGRSLQETRLVRDDIDRRVRALLAELV